MASPLLKGYDHLIICKICCHKIEKRLFFLAVFNFSEYAGRRFWLVAGQTLIRVEFHFRQSEVNDIQFIFQLQ